MVHNQDFFLDLAAKGKNAWNAWRRDPANKNERVTFAGIDFSEAPNDQIDFSGFEFGDEADFSGCKWRGVVWADIEEDLKRFKTGRACFTGAVFGHRARFNGAMFGGWATLSGATFGGMPMFTGASFSDRADFNGATFGNVANFGGATFGDAAQFDSATFGAAIFENATFANEAIFTGAAFRSAPTFDGAAFGDEAHFDHTNFEGVDFTGKSKEQWTRDVKANVGWMGEEARKTLEKQHEGSWKRDGSGPDHFLTIYFERARFDGEATFSGRTFERTADFTNTRFHYPPDFDTPTNAARIHFTGTHIGFVPPGKRAWTEDSRVPLRLRALRKIAEETKNHDLERDLYIEERKAERGVYWHQGLEDLKKGGWKNWPRNAARLAVHILWIGVMGVYWALADYGRSFMRPTIALGLSWYGSYWLYRWVLSSIMATARDIDSYKQAVWMLALGNTVPLIGPLTIDPKIKEFLFCAGEIADKCARLPPEGFQFLVIAQNLLSIILVFFIGLALRNYFRIK